MKKIRLPVFRWLLILILFVSLYLPNCCLVSAREGLSDAELYGNGQESVLYQGTKQNPSGGNGAKNKSLQSEAKGKDKPKEPAIDNDKVEDKDEEDKVDINEVKIKPSDDEAENENGSFENREAFQNNVSGDAVVITGVEPDGVYNKDVIIEISVIKPEEEATISAQLYKLSEEQVPDTDENSDKVNTGKAASIAVNETGNIADIEDRRNRQPGLQIGLSAVGQLVSGRQQVSEEGSYELVIQQSTNRQQEEYGEAKVIKALAFVLDKTAPIIDRKLIEKLCENRIDIEEICQRAVQDESEVMTACYVNEQKLEKGVIERPGDYELTIEARDKAGNETKEQLQITLPGQTEPPGQRSRWMVSSVIVMMFGGGLLVWEGRKEKKEDEYEPREKK